MPVVPGGHQGAAELQVKHLHSILCLCKLRCFAEDDPSILAQTAPHVIHYVRWCLAVQLPRYPAFFCLCATAAVLESTISAFCGSHLNVG